MADRSDNKEQLGREKAQGSGAPPRVGEALEDEEKILAGRTDVNMPALLTRDVLGG